MQVWLCGLGNVPCQSVYLSCPVLVATELATEVSGMCSSIHTQKGAILVGTGALPEVCGGCEMMAIK